MLGAECTLRVVAAMLRNCSYEGEAPQHAVLVRCEHSRPS